MTQFLRALLLGSALSLGGMALTASPAAAEISAEKLGELPLVYDAAISPNGKKVAVFLNYDGVYGLRVFDLENLSGEPVGALLNEDSKPRWVKWANDGRVLMSVTQSQKIGTTPIDVGSIYTFDVEENKGKWLIKPQRGRSIGSNIGGRGDFFEQFYNQVVDFLDDDPDHILMTFMTDYQNVRPVHKVEVATGRFETIERGNDNVQTWLTDNSGTVRVARGLRDNAKTVDQRFLRIRDASGEWHNGEHWTGLKLDTPIYGFTSNPNEMVVGLRRGRDTRGLYVYDLGQRRITRELFHNDEYDVNDIVVDSDSGEVIGASYTGEETEIELFDGYDTTMEAIRRKYPEYQVRLFDSANEGKSILFRLSSPYDPGMLLIQREGKASPEKITDMRPGVASDEMGMVIPVKYTASDGQKIPSYVTLPPTVNDTAGIKNLPFIVLPHGGPWARDAARFDWFAQFFASRGYGVLQMNFRGSTGYGESFAKEGAENWDVMRSDVTDGAKWLVEKGYADPERMCVAGWSFGGYAALMNGIEHPELFSCVVSIAALSDIPLHLEEMKDYRFGRASQSYITKGFDGKDDMKAKSPARIAEQMVLPTFIVHGAMDQSVQYSQHRRLRKALERSEAKLTEISFKDDDHYMSRQDNRQAMLKALDKFLVSVNGRSEFIKE